MDARRCSGFEADLSALLDGELPAQRAAELRAHLDACDSCRAAADELQRTSRILADLPMTAAPPGLLERVLREAGAASVSRSRPSGRRTLWLRIMQVSASAAALLVTAVAARTFLLHRVDSPAAAPAVPAPADSTVAVRGLPHETIAQGPATADDALAATTRDPGPIGGGRPAGAAGAAREAPAGEDVGRTMDALVSSQSPGQSVGRVAVTKPDSAKILPDAFSRDAEAGSAIAGTGASEPDAAAGMPNLRAPAAAPLDAAWQDTAVAQVALTVIAADRDEYERAASIVSRWESGLPVSAERVTSTDRTRAAKRGDAGMHPGAGPTKDGDAEPTPEWKEHQAPASAVRAFMSDLSGAGLENVTVQISAGLPVVGRVSEALQRDAAPTDVAATERDQLRTVVPAPSEAADVGSRKTTSPAVTDLPPPSAPPTTTGGGRSRARDDSPAAGTAAAPVSSAPTDGAPREEKMADSEPLRDRAAGRGGLVPGATQPVPSAASASRGGGAGTAAALGGNEDGVRTDEEPETPTDPAAWKAVAERLRVAADIGARVAGAASESFRGLFGVAAVPSLPRPVRAAAPTDDPILRVRVTLIPPPQMDADRGDTPIAPPTGVPAPTRSVNGDAPPSRNAGAPAADTGSGDNQTGAPPQPKH
ncbi:MAG: zf-HC2 domain-containing protein [Planctomycetia bacterium]|nr:MAG: zf-HC2 domain-containing protein [Planctomycetia bacterium]